MKILAIDTSNKPLSIAILDDYNLLSSKTININRNHSVLLLNSIDKLLKEININMNNIDRIVVAEGPGSYTGLRVGITTAKTLASILNKELVGISSLKVIAANISPQSNVLLVPFFDARNLNVFGGIYEWINNRLINIIPDQHITFKNLCSKLSHINKKKIFIGPCNDIFLNIIKKSIKNYDIVKKIYQIPSAYVLGYLGIDCEPVDPDTFIPKYNRLTQAEMQWMKNHPEEKNIYGNYVEKI